MNDFFFIRCNLALKTQINAEGLCFSTNYFIETRYKKVCDVNIHVDCASYKVIAVLELIESHTIAGENVRFRIYGLLLKTLKSVLMSPYSYKSKISIC